MDPVLDPNCYHSYNDPKGCDGSVQSWLSTELGLWGSLPKHSYIRSMCKKHANGWIKYMIERGGSTEAITQEEVDIFRILSS